MDARRCSTGHAHVVDGSAGAPHQGGSHAWVKVSINERIALLEELRRAYHAIAEPSVRAACQAKGIDPESPTAGEEWLAGPLVVLRNLRLLVESLQDIQRHGAPYIPPRG